jgi:DNA-binding NarL/FixJ family response regulator
VKKQVDPASASNNWPLICLNKFSLLENKYDKDEAALDNILSNLVLTLPEALRYPESASVRILIMPISFKSKGFIKSKWKYVSEIKAFGEPVGSLEVFYEEDFPRAFNGPFTADEVMLFSYISTRISRIIERLQTRKQLEIESTSLKNTNIALNEVLNRIKEDQSEVSSAIQANVSKVILPLLVNLSQNVRTEQKRLVELVSESLREITSPYVSKLSNRFMTLTPQEVLICHMIKNGFSSKEIAEARVLSVATVNTHRENIRRKLELNNKKVNLKSYLINYLGDSSMYI